MVRIERGREAERARVARIVATAGSAAALALLTSCQAGSVERTGGTEPTAGAGTTDAAVMADLEVTVDALEAKLLSLAEAMDEDLYGWRPMEGVRSVGEVYLHVAADNYFMPILAGVAAPAGTGITIDYEATVVPFEARVRTKAETLAVLEDSFGHLRASMAASPPLGQERDVFGTAATVGSVWVQAVTHLHEHLGQSIAYARTNQVVPPWSRPPA